MVIARTAKLAELLAAGHTEPQAAMAEEPDVPRPERSVDAWLAGRYPERVAMIDVGLDAVRARLSQRMPKIYDGEAQRQAAIAAILREGPCDTEVLLIRRAEREGDPWSGHVALPGGKQDPSDADLLATAQRETLEEVGIDLGEHEFLGALDQHPATAEGRFTGLLVAPYVFGLRRDAELRPNREVAAFAWAPLGRMARGEVDVVKELTRNGQRVRFPGFAVGELVVWGLTHRVLCSLLSTLA